MKQTAKTVPSKNGRDKINHQILEHYKPSNIHIILNLRPRMAIEVFKNNPFDLLIIIKVIFVNSLLFDRCRFSFEFTKRKSKKVIRSQMKL